MFENIKKIVIWGTGVYGKSLAYYLTNKNIYLFVLIYTIIIGMIKFGEFTFSPASGFYPKAAPYEKMIELGKLIELKNEN